MNEKMKKALEAAAEDIRNMPRDEFFKSIFGFTPEEEKAYTQEKFLEELTNLRTFFVNGQYSFEPKYNGEPEATVSKLFWHYINAHARSNYQDTTETFPTYYIELPQYGIRVTQIYGQGTLTIVEDFDYSDVKYIISNATRLKREAVWREKERIKEMLRGKPNLYDEVRFSTEVNGIGIVDTGVVTKVYTKKGVIRYMIDSVHNGTVLVYFEQGEKYPMDMVEVTVYHPDNYDNY